MTWRSSKMSLSVRPGSRLQYKVERKAHLVACANFGSLVHVSSTVDARLRATVDTPSGGI
jgi:hypothetical protein